MFSSSITETPLLNVRCSSNVRLRDDLKTVEPAIVAISPGRLVSGIQLPRQKYSFLGTLTFNRNLESLWQPTITCTVSLIAPFWVLSAAHCLGKKSALHWRSCIQGANCTRNDKEDFSYRPEHAKSYIRLGVSDFYAELEDVMTYEIEEIIRPKNAYPSNGYGVILTGLAQF